MAGGTYGELSRLTGYGYQTIKSCSGVYSQGTCVIFCCMFFGVTFHPVFGRKSFWVFVLLLHTSDSLSSIYPLKSVRRPCPVYFYYRFYDYTDIALSLSCTKHSDLLSMVVYKK